MANRRRMFSVLIYKIVMIKDCREPLIRKDSGQFTLV